MKTASLVLLLVASICGTASAGPNVNGTLLVHVNPSVVFTVDTSTYCGASGLTSCIEANPNHSGSESVVAFVVAAFPSSAPPVLAGVTFGISYDCLILGQVACADFELAESNWPASGSGTALTWNTARTTPIVECYWFAAYNYYAPAPASFCVTPHPTQGGYFADDSVPSLLDPIAAYGCLGFDTPGSAPCLNPPPGIGACCLPSNECVLITEEECLAQGGTFHGAGSQCDPSPCPSIGACCFADGVCVLSTEGDCLGQGGEWQGDATVCDPNPCEPPVPAREASWGGIKARYR